MSVPLSSEPGSWGLLMLPIGICALLLVFALGLGVPEPTAEPNQARLGCRAVEPMACLP